MVKKFEELNENRNSEEGKCYVFLNGNDINEEHYLILVRKSKSSYLQVN